MANFTLDVTTIEETPSYRTLISNFEDGTEQRRSITSGSFRQFKCSSVNLTEAQAQEYQDFFDARSGGLSTFTWDSHLDDVTYTLRFSPGSFRRVYSEGRVTVYWEWEEVR